MSDPNDAVKLFSNNREWAEQTEQDDPGFFARLAPGQAPKFFWIGCSDSRVPVSLITGSKPGEVFVHRNVANKVGADDPSCMAALEYAVTALHVEHVVVCGHYGCGGAKAAMEGMSDGIVGHWIADLRQLYDDNRDTLEDMSESDAFDRFCELNVQRQVRSLCATSVVQEAWRADVGLNIHGWIYELVDGHLQKVVDAIASQQDFERWTGE